MVEAKARPSCPLMCSIKQPLYQQCCLTNFCCSDSSHSMFWCLQVSHVPTAAHLPDPLVSSQEQNASEQQPVAEAWVPPSYANAAAPCDRPAAAHSCRPAAASHSGSVAASTTPALAAHRQPGFTSHRQPRAVLHSESVARAHVIDLTVDEQASPSSSAGSDCQIVSTDPASNWSLLADSDLAEAGPREHVQTDPELSFTSQSNTAQLVGPTIAQNCEAAFPRHTLQRHASQPVSGSIRRTRWDVLPEAMQAARTVEPSAPELHAAQLQGPKLQHTGARPVGSIPGSEAVQDDLPRRLIQHTVQDAHHACERDPHAAIGQQRLQQDDTSDDRSRSSLPVLSHSHDTDHRRCKQPREDLGSDGHGPQTCMRRTCYDSPRHRHRHSRHSHSQRTASQKAVAAVQQPEGCGDVHSGCLHQRVPFGLDRWQMWEPQGGMSFD